MFVLVASSVQREVHVPSDIVVQDHASAHTYAVPVAEDAVVVTVKVQVPDVISIPNGVGVSHAYPLGVVVEIVPVRVVDDVCGSTLYSPVDFAIFCEVLVDAVPVVVARFSHFPEHEPSTVDPR
jgi:hypothetical protein